ncbi:MULTISPECIES: phage tail sheath C-terminal domain-containing protein [unclassified Mesotoga]|uniref:phage tail sheath C-terminal domain-containing protein n=1 Tax=unclassified Mesotoga TaxID=1184398 RepID=UPI000DA6A224|nr:MULTISPECIES: phage tail sheath C-terminal domain-containing protein [unclassified Mesotoga]PZC52318.1 hypothetical protein LH53_05745 [Mesotoga sp. TolDC]
MSSIIPGVTVSVNTFPVAPNVSGNGGTVGFVGDFVFGPTNEVITINTSGEINTKLGGLTKADARALYAILLQKPKALKVVRVVGSAAEYASKALGAGAETALTLTAKYKGAYGNNITVAVANGVLTLVYGSTTETFSFTTLDGLVELINATSTLVTAVKDGSVVPDDITPTAFTLGSDGTVNDASYIGGFDSSSDTRTGLSLFETDADIDIVTIGGTPSSAKNTALMEHCSSLNRIAAVPIIASTLAAAITEVSSYVSADGQNTTMYPNPKFEINGTYYTINGGMVYAGIAGRMDPHRSTANQFVFGCVGTDRGLTAAEMEQLIVAYVNPLTLKGTGYAVRHGLMLSSTPDWRQIGVRRVFNIIARDLDGILDTYVGEPNGADLWKKVTTACDGYLNGLKRADWIEEFSNVCDASINTAEVVSTGRLLAQSYVKPRYIAHYIEVELNKVISITVEERTA